MKVQQLAHVVLRVRDPDASAAWYKDVLGLHETYRIAGRMVFLTARDDSSHELALMGLGPIRIKLSSEGEAFAKDLGI